MFHYFHWLPQTLIRAKKPEHILYIPSAAHFNHLSRSILWLNSFKSLSSVQFNPRKNQICMNKAELGPYTEWLLQGSWEPFKISHPFQPFPIFHPKIYSATKVHYVFQTCYTETNATVGFEKQNNTWMVLIVWEGPRFEHGVCARWI